MRVESESVGIGDEVGGYESAMNSDWDCRRPGGLHRRLFKRREQSPGALGSRRVSWIQSCCSVLSTLLLTCCTVSQLNHSYLRISSS